MKVIVNTDHIKIIELEDFKKFHIEAIGTLDQITQQFHKNHAGYITHSERAEVKISFIEQQAGVKLKDSTWLNGFKMMLSYANSKGWINQENQTVFAHIEWVPTLISET